MLHLGRESRFSADVVERSLTMLESTSPSALLSGSLDLARHELVHAGRTMLDRTLVVLGATDRTLSTLGVVA